jgi:uncharacterized membrane protein YbhN (UPF0104 family)
MMTLLRDFGEALGQARAPLLGLALVLHLLSLILTAERWRIVVSALGLRLTLARMALVNLAGMFVRNTMPAAGIGGDASRIVLLRAEGLTLAEASAALAYVRLGEIPQLVLATALSVPAAIGLMNRPGRGATIVVAAIGLTICLGWIGQARIRSLLVGLWTRTKHLRIDAGSMGLATFYGLFSQSKNLVRLILVTAAFREPLTIPQAAAVNGLMMLGGLVPTIGSLGAIEGSLIAGLLVFGVPGQTAVLITIVDRGISYALDTALGAAAVAFLGGGKLLRLARSRPPTADTSE